MTLSDRILSRAGILTARLPAPLGQLLRRLAFAGRSRLCPACGRSARRYLPTGVVPRPDAVCPWCQSLKRHRLVWFYLRRSTPLFTRPSRLLHLVPEPSLRGALGRAGVPQVTTDLSPCSVDVASDLTALAFADGSFDAVYCSHVLEHVPDDRAAMRELHRVIRLGGFAVIQVPVQGDATYEDFGITTPEGRLEAFGQTDHVRVYGTDVTERLRSAGLRVSALRVVDMFDDGEIERYALDRDEVLFHCDRDD